MVRLVNPVLQVIQGDVDEALRLMSMSKISLEDEELQEQIVKDPVREAFSKVCCCLVHNEYSQLSSAPLRGTASHKFPSCSDPALN